MTTKYTVQSSNATIETTVTNTATGINDWVQAVTNSSGQKMIVGLDCEWKPNTFYGDDNKAATLQLCVGTKCLIIQLFYLDYVPQSLKSFFANPNATFVGVEVGDDVSKLTREYGLTCSNAVDIQAMAMNRWPIRFYRKPGLKELAQVVAGVTMAKPIHVCRSNWEARALSLEQIEYACIDAYASSKIGEKLIE